MRILITGTGSFVGESVRSYILKNYEGFEIDAVDTMEDRWKTADFASYDCVYHVAGIAHVNADPSMEPLYYKVNRDLTIEVARTAKEAGVGQFIFMSSMIVFHESQSLANEVITPSTTPAPNGFYGDSKLQAENGIKELEDDNFKVCILRPPMIYGPGGKGNFPRLQKLALKTPIFPAFHNKRSMLYIDNLAEFVMNAAKLRLSGTFYPQNASLADTVEIIRFFAAENGHKVWITPLLNPFVRLFAHFLQPLNKMFATYYYDPRMSEMDFDYRPVSFEESLVSMNKSLK